MTALKLVAVELPACVDCGAAANVACDPSCPMADPVAATVDDDAVVCCPSPAAAAAALCFCWGGAA